jgi:hypothetical protein
MKNLLYRLKSFFQVEILQNFSPKNHCLKMLHNSLVPNLLNLHITINAKLQLRLHIYFSCACVYFAHGIFCLFFLVGLLGRRQDNKALALQALIAYICIIVHSILSKVITPIVEHTLIQEHLNSS